MGNAKIDHAADRPMGTKIFFPNLDGLRFIAFFLVFWQHGTERLFTNLRIAGITSDDYERYFVTGGIGVSFFFVLSGFLITYLLLDEKKRNGNINVTAFYSRRILRIFPLFYLVVSWGFGIYPIIRRFLGLPEVYNGSLMLYALFLGNFNTIYSAEPNAGFLGVLWSVCVEEQFYLVWAFLFFYLPIRFYKYLFPAIIIASTLFRFFNADNGKVIYYHTFSVVSDLAVGAGLAYLAITYIRFSQYLENLSRFLILLIYLTGFTLIWFYPHLLWLDEMPWLQRLVFSLFFAFVIAEQNYATNSFFKMKDLKIISKLGIYTYGLYCLHMISLYLIELVFQFARLDQEKYFVNLLFFTSGLVISILFSYLSYEYFEQRFLRMKRHFAV